MQYGVDLEEITDAQVKMIHGFLKCVQPIRYWTSSKVQ